MGRFSGFSSIHSSDGRKGKTQKPENLLIYKAFWVLKSFRLPPRKKQVFLERFWDTLFCSFPNFLSKNGHGGARDKMHCLPVQKLLAFRNDHLTIILTEHTNMRLV